jgi:hypothetical protein
MCCNNLFLPISDIVGCVVVTRKYFYFWYYLVLLLVIGGFIIIISLVLRISISIITSFFYFGHFSPFIFLLVFCFC